MRAAVIWIIALFAVFSWVVCWQEVQIVRLRRQMNAQAVAGDENSEQVGELGRKLRDGERAQVVTDSRLMDLDRRNAGAPNLAELLRRDADFAAFWQKDVRRLVLNRYGDALSGLKLPPESLDKLKNLLVARSEAPLDAQEVAEKEGVADGSQVMGRAIAEATGEVNREIAALLGAGGYRRFVDLTSAPAGVDPPSNRPDDGANVLPNQPGAEIASAGVAVAADQTNPPGQVYPPADEPTPPPIDETVTVPPADAAAGLTVADEVVIIQASRVLSPEQLKILRREKIDRRRKLDGGKPAVPPGAAKPAAPPAAGNQAPKEN